MKKLLCYLLLICAIPLSSCGNMDYSDNVRCSDIADSVKKVLSDGKEYERYGEEHIRYNFENTDLHDDACILYSADSTDINEIGILHASREETVEDLAKNTEKYLRDIKVNQRAFIESYAPNEITKLDSSRIYIFGNYIVYTILPSSERDAAIEEIEKSLLK